MKDWETNHSSCERLLMRFLLQFYCYGNPPQTINNKHNNLEKAFLHFNLEYVQLNQKLHTFNPLVDRIQVPFQIEDDLIHWLIGVKCRKITHGYCTLKIVSGLQIQNYNYTRDIMHTRQHGHHKHANSNSNSKYMGLCIWRHFPAPQDREDALATVASFTRQQQLFIYMWLLPHIHHSMLSNRKFKGSAQ